MKGDRSTDPGKTRPRTINIEGVVAMTLVDGYLPEEHFYGTLGGKSSIRKAQARASNENPLPYVVIFQRRHLRPSEVKAWQEEEVRRTSISKKRKGGAV